MGEALEYLSKVQTIMPIITQDVITKNKTLYWKEILESKNKVKSLLLKELFT